MSWQPTPIPTMSKADLEALSGQDKVRFARAGGRMAATSNGAFVPTEIPTATRAEFLTWTPKQRFFFVKLKGQLYDKN